MYLWETVCPQCGEYLEIMNPDVYDDIYCDKCGFLLHVGGDFDDELTTELIKAGKIAPEELAEEIEDELEEEYYEEEYPEEHEFMGD